MFRPAQIDSVINALRLIGSSVAVSDLIADITAAKPSLAASIDRTLTFLSDAGIIEFPCEDTVRLCPEIASAEAQSEVHTELSRKILSRLLKDRSLEQIADSMQRQEKDGSLLIDSRLLPWEHRSFRDLFLRLGIFQRERLDQRHWRIPDEYTSYFMSATRQANLANFHIKGITPKIIADKIEENVKEGSSVEKWVLTRELERLDGHPLIDLVTCISEINAEVGYDILSFSTTRSYYHDHFIEVKSYSGTEHFYWSKKEVEVAKDFGNKYYLYIIDRSRICNPDYKPKVIRGPYGYYFEHKPKGWKFDTSSYHFEFSP